MKAADLSKRLEASLPRLKDHGFVLTDVWTVTTGRELLVTGGIAGEQLDR